MLKITLTATAALLMTAAAPAQRVDGEFRLMWASDDGVSLVTTDVTGPRTARNLTEVIVRAKRAPSGSDVYAIDTVANCAAGTLSIGDVIAYQDDRVLARIPADPNEVSKVAPGTNAYVVYNYACTGKGPGAENERPVGLTAVIAYGRKRLGL